MKRFRGNTNKDDTCWEVVVGALTVVFIACVHLFAIRDHVVMNAYYIILWGAAYVLTKRRKLTMMVFVLTVAFGTDLAQTYLGQPVGPSSILAHAGIDTVTWCVLLGLFGLLAREAFVINSEIRRFQVQRAIEQKVISARSAALTCIAHELRTPIASVVACVETLESTMEGKIDDIERRFLGMVHDSSRHLVELVDKLLDYGKAKTGGISFSPKTVQLPDLIADAVGMVEPQGIIRDIRIDTQIDPNVVEIVADPLHLKQIVLNLLSNAVKHSPAGKSVKVSVEADANDILVHVRDEGQGMSAEQAQHIFDPYYQATAADEKVGTGLGLGIVKLLVGLHSGSISVESQPGGGSTFSVRLPQTDLPKRRNGDEEAETWESVVVSDSVEDFDPSNLEFAAEAATASK